MKQKGSAGRPNNRDAYLPRERPVRSCRRWRMRPRNRRYFQKNRRRRLFLEYDTERTGGLEPLGLLSRGNQRVLPRFITTKSGNLESIDNLKRKFDEASKYADIEQLGIAPQCGFASTEEGNKLTEYEQWKRLELVVRTAEEIWGSV